MTDGADYAGACQFLLHPDGEDLQRRYDRLDAMRAEVEEQYRQKPGMAAYIQELTEYMGARERVHADVMARVRELELRDCEQRERILHLQGLNGELDLQVMYLSTRLSTLQAKAGMPVAQPDSGAIEDLPHQLHDLQLQPLDAGQPTPLGNDGLFQPPPLGNDGLFQPLSNDGLFQPPPLGNNDGLFQPPLGSNDGLFQPLGNDAQLSFQQLSFQPPPLGSDVSQGDIQRGDIQRGDEFGDERQQGLQQSDEPQFYDTVPTPCTSSSISSSTSSIASSSPATAPISGSPLAFALTPHSSPSASVPLSIKPRKSPVVAADDESEDDLPVKRMRSAPVATASAPAATAEAPVATAATSAPIAAAVAPSTASEAFIVSAAASALMAMMTMAAQKDEAVNEEGDTQEDVAREQEAQEDDAQEAQEAQKAVVHVDTPGVLLSALSGKTGKTQRIGPDEWLVYMRRPVPALREVHVHALFAGRLVSEWHYAHFVRNQHDPQAVEKHLVVGGRFMQNLFCQSTQQRAKKNPLATYRFAKNVPQDWRTFLVKTAELPVNAVYGVEELDREGICKFASERLCMPITSV